MCRGFVAVVGDFLMAIVLSWIVSVHIEGRYASARMALTGVVRRWPVIVRPAQR